MSLSKHVGFIDGLQTGGEE